MTKEEMICKMFAWSNDNQYYMKDYPKFFNIPKERIVEVFKYWEKQENKTTATRTAFALLRKK